MDPITIDVWKPAPEKPGYVVLDYRRPVGEIIADLNARLETEGLAPEEYGFKVLDYAGRVPGPRDPWPAGRWVACYAVTGANEGHYIHVDVIQQHDGRQPDTRVSIALGKTFEGWERAAAIAAAAGKHLGA